MSGGGGGGSQQITSTNTTKTEPPAYLQPYAVSLLQQGSKMASQPYQPYPGMTLAPLSPEHQAALYAGGQRATQGSPVQGAANWQLQNTLYGGGFDNPWLDSAVRQAQQQVMPEIGYMARESGSFGNSGINEAAARTYGDIATQMNYQNYSAERDRQMQAAQMAPQAAQADIQDIQFLMGLGDVKRQYQQELVDNAVGQWDAAMNWPYSQAEFFLNALRGAGYGTYGSGSSTSTQPNPNQSSGLANLIGGGLAGAGLLSGFF
jgi:hypothetical protein